MPNIPYESLAPRKSISGHWQACLQQLTIFILIVISENFVQIIVLQPVLQVITMPVTLALACAIDNPQQHWPIIDRPMPQENGYTSCPAK